MAWTAPLTWTANTTLTAAQLNQQLRDNFLELDVAKITQEGEYVVSTGANALTTRIAAFDTVTSTDTKTASTYGALGSGPAVTVTTGTLALIFITAEMFTNTEDTHAKASYAISGATTSSGADSRSILFDGTALNNACRLAFVDVRTDLNAGSNTFTMHYASDGAATASFRRRHMAVIPL